MCGWDQYEIQQGLIGSFHPDSSRERAVEKVAEFRSSLPHLFEKFKEQLRAYLADPSMTFQEKAEEGLDWVFGEDSEAHLRWIWSVMAPDEPFPGEHLSTKKG